MILAEFALILTNINKQKLYENISMASIFEELDTICMEDGIISSVSDEEIIESLKNMDTSTDASVLNLKKISSKEKKSITQIADEAVKNYIEDKSDKNWQSVQSVYWYGLNSFAYKYTNNWDDAYDMTIETFIKAYESIGTYNPELSKFSTWLWTICRNSCTQLKKKRMKLPTVNNDLSDIYESTLTKNSNICIDTNINVDFQMNKGEIERVHADDISLNMYSVSVEEIDRIGGITGDILKMKLVDNKKIKDIALEKSMNESTVKNYLYQGKKNLTRIMKIKHKDLYDMYVETCIPQEECMYQY